MHGQVCIEFTTSILTKVRSATRSINGLATCSLSSIRLQATTWWSSIGHSPMTKETPGWGGSRKNAGRKQIVRRELLRTDAGRWCENRWRELAEQAAKQRRE